MLLFLCTSTYFMSIVVLMPPKEQTMNLFVDLGFWHSSATQKHLTVLVSRFCSRSNSCDFSRKGLDASEHDPCKMAHRTVSWFNQHQGAPRRSSSLNPRLLGAQALDAWQLEALLCICSSAC